MEEILNFLYRVSERPLVKTLRSFASPELVAKLFLLQFYLFGYGIVSRRKKLFTIAKAMAQTFLLAFLASLENLKFRYG